MEEINIFKCNFCFRQWNEYESQRKFKLRNFMYVMMKYVKHFFYNKYNRQKCFSCKMENSKI